MTWDFSEMEALRVSRKIFYKNLLTLSKISEEQE